MVGVEEYAWAQGNPRLDAYCVTAVAGAKLDGVLAAFGADAGTETVATFEEAFNGFPSPTYVLAEEVSGGVLVVEHNGWLGVGDDVVAKASSGATLASYYRNVNAVMAFVHAVDGRIVAMFDPLLESVPLELQEQADGLPFGVEQTEASAFALLERLTGIGLGEEWLTSPRRRYDVPARA